MSPAMSTPPRGDALVDDDAVYSKIAWRLLPLLMLAWLFAYIDRVNISFAKLQMASDLGFSDAVYGFGAGIFFLGYFLFEVPSNLILHKVGARRWIGRIMITWSIIAGLTAFIRTPSEFYGARFLLGLAEAGFIPGTIYHLSQWFPGHRRGRVFGVFYLALAGSGLVGGPVSGAVLEWMSGLLGVAGWKWLLLLEALPSLIVGIVIILRLPERPGDAAWLTAAERRYVTDSLARERSAQPDVPAATVWRNPVLWLLTLIYFLLAYAAGGLSYWLPTLVKELGFRNAFTIGLVSAVPSICSMVCMVLFGRSADRHGERRWHATAMILIGGTGFLLSVLAGGHLMAGLAGLCMAAICTQAYPSLFWAIPARMLSGVAAAAGFAVINSFGNTGGFVGPYVVGLLRQGGGAETAVYSLAGALVLAAALVHLLPSRLIDRVAQVDDGAVSVADHIESRA